MNEERDCNFVSERARKIGEIVEERDELITETDARIQYYINSLENLKHDFKELEKIKNDICEDQKVICVQIQQIVAIKECAQKSHKVTVQALVYQQIMEKSLKEKFEQQEKMRNTLLQELEKNCVDTETQLKERNPLYHQLQVKKTECLRNQIAVKVLERNIRERRKINSEKVEMQKKLFYADFIKLAESYFIAQSEIKLEILKHERTKEIMKLHELQEQVKMKNKIGRSYHNISIKKIVDQNILAEPQRLQIETKVSSQESKKVDSHFEELDKLFAISQTVAHSIPSPSEEHINPKIIIMDEHILPQMPLTPASVASKRKRPVVDVYSRWKKMNSSYSKETLVSSQQSNKCSQPSQQTQISESSQKSLSQGSQLSQRSQVNLDDGHFRKDELSDVTSKFKHNSAEDHPVILNNGGVEEGSKIAYPCREINMDITQGAEVEMIRENVKFDVPHQVTESATEGTQVLSGTKSTPKTPVNEPNKSVRFKLNNESNPKKEAKSMFGGLSLFEPSTFSSFFKKTPVQQFLETTTNQELNDPPNVSTLDSSMVFGNSTRLSVGSDAYRSPEFDISEDGGNFTPFDAPAMTSFGFSFGSKNLFK